MRKKRSASIVKWFVRMKELHDAGLDVSRPRRHGSWNVSGVTEVTIRRRTAIRIMGRMCDFIEGDLLLGGCAIMGRKGSRRILRWDRT